jgi:hypothetical protein
MKANYNTMQTPKLYLKLVSTFALREVVKEAKAIVKEAQAVVNPVAALLGKPSLRSGAKPPGPSCTAGAAHSSQASLERESRAPLLRSGRTGRLREAV